MTAYNNDPEGGTTPPFETPPAEMMGGAVEAAELYASRGLCTVPNARGTKRPTRKGWTDLRLGVEDAPRYFEEGQNIGLLLGEPSGWLVDVDLDCPEAVEVADWLLPDTLSSGRRGAPRSHRFFVSEGARSKSWKTSGDEGTVLVEVRATGAQTLVEPSVHPSGEPYTWDRDGVLEAVEIPAHQLETSCTKIATGAAIARRLPRGGRHDFALALAGHLLRQGADQETVVEVMSAAWHAAGADDPEAINDLQRIVWDTTEKLSSGEMVTGGPTLEEAAPGLPALLARWWGRSAEAGAGAGGMGSIQAVSGGTGDERGPTHDELRDRWIAGQDSPMAFGQGEWRRYEAGYWQPVHDQEVYGSIDAVLEAAKSEGTRPTAGARSSVERMARAKLFVADEVWDSKDDILVCANGTLEISSMTLREHRAGDYALGAAPFGYDPEAQAPTFDAFLSSTVPDAAPFLQEYSGYALTPDTSHETALWLQGPPGTGKSTFIEAIKAMLGPRVGILGLTDVERSRFALSKITGKTLLTATEQPADFISSTHVLNALISGEEVQVEEKFKPSYTVVPGAKLLWGMNTLPRIKDANSGLFRRVKVVSFSPLRVERDPKLKDRIKAEAPGILNWALEGLRRLRERGHFGLPEVVRNATEGFHEANDVPAMFVREACVVSDAVGCEEQAQNLYFAYRHWCKENGHKPLSSTAAAAEWARLGFGSRRLNGRRLYTGVKVDEGWIRVQEDYRRR